MIAASFVAVFVLAAIVVGLVVFLGGDDEGTTTTAPTSTAASTSSASSSSSSSGSASSSSSSSSSSSGGGGNGTLIEGTPTSPDGLGDDPELDEYAQSCFDGSIEGCLSLYGASPIDSTYEMYAESCGGRVPWTEESSVFDCFDY